MAKKGNFSYNSTIGDYLYGYNDYGISKMRLKSLVSVNEKEDVESENSYLYIYPPYPNPAKNYVRAIVYWDSSAPIEYAKVNIYNCNGDLVAGKESTNAYKIRELSWHLRMELPRAALGRISHCNYSRHKHTDNKMRSKQVSNSNIHTKKGHRKMSFFCIIFKLCQAKGFFKSSRHSREGGNLSYSYIK